MGLSLNYQPRRSRRRRLRVILVVLLCVALGVVAKRRGPAAWRRMQLAYRIHRCMTYSPPLGQVVYEDGMASPLVTWEDGRSVVGASPPASTDNPEAHEREVRCWSEFDKLAAISASVGISSNVLFLHERRDEKGRRWLVALFFNGRSLDRLELAELIISPESSGSGVHYTSGYPLMILPPEYLRDQHGCEQPTKKLTLFAGQPDPKDPSRFSVRFGLGEYTGHIDYVLRGPSPESSDEPHLDFAGGNYIHFDQPPPAEEKP